MTTRCLVQLSACNLASRTNNNNSKTHVRISDEMIEHIKKQLRDEVIAEVRAELAGTDAAVVDKSPAPAHERWTEEDYEMFLSCI